MSTEHNVSGDGAERILNAAIKLFGEHGVRGTTLKSIAAEANVSQALIVHHYGTKEGLRSACDAYVADVIRERKEETLAEPQFDPLMTLRRLEQGRPLLRYLIRTLTEGGAHAAQLIDGMVADAKSYMSQGERDGVIKPSDTPHDRAVVLVIWSMGALALHEHVERLLGVDFLAENVPPESLQRYLRPALELFKHGLVEDGSFDHLAAFLGEEKSQGTTQTSHDDKK
ncbi:TetR family transcriptional regulator [Yaniella halotolerans]|uniref:TetR family transcriptional regulator n=1 Tax=Yaniella halotolerans TaxID=225453 RepID=UPI0003B6515F|nr:TetR family transcriptional regulator [Yaniella halotolerans]